jgi:hypothetical protein
MEWNCHARERATEGRESIRILLEFVLLDIDSRGTRNEAQKSSRDGNLMRRAWPKEGHVSDDR